MAGAFSSAFSSAFDGGADPVPVLDRHIASGGGWMDRRREPLSAARDERKREQIVTELRALYREVYEKAAPESEVAEEAAAVVTEYVPTSAPDLPPPDMVDWMALVEEGAALVAEVRATLRLLRERAEDDDITILLMTL